MVEFSASQAVDGRDAGGVLPTFDNGANCLGMTMYTLKSPILTLNVDIATC